MGAGVDSQDFPIDYVIFSTGAGIMEFPSGRLIYKKAIDHFDIQKVTTCFDECRIDYMVHKAIPDTCLFIYKCFGDQILIFMPGWRCIKNLHNLFLNPLKTLVLLHR